MACYQLTLFYPNIKDHARSIEGVREEIRRAAGSNFRVLSAGEQVCAIAFETDIPSSELKGRFAGTGKEGFHFLLTQITLVVAGYMTEDSWRWIARHCPVEK